jgi:hypothetical protein
MSEKPYAHPPTPKKFNRHCFDQVIEHLLEGMQTHPAIEKAGISVRHFYRELKKHPDWAKQFKDTQIERDQIKIEQRIEAAEAELYRRAVDGWDQQVFDDQGRLKGSRRRYSDQCLIFLLRKLKQERYGDNPTLIKNQIQITQKDEKEMLAEWRSRL